MLLNLSFRIIRLIMETYWVKPLRDFFIPFFSISPHSFHLQKVDDVANCRKDIPHTPRLKIRLVTKVKVPNHNKQR